MLDTNIVSELIRNPGGRAAQRTKQAGGAVCVSAIVAAELEAAGRPIGSNDLLIAARARSLDATLVTANTRVSLG